MSKKVTIKTIAQDLGISFSTVAKALNHDPKIKKETADLVNKRAQELGYRPNLMARGLRGSSTKSIGFILNDVENPSLAYIFKRISIKMGELGYTTLICDSQYNATIERRNILSVLSKGADTLILFPVSSEKNNIDLLNEIKEKVILIGNGMEYPQFHCVAIDYALGGYLSAKEMLSHGHKDLVIFTEPDDFPASRLYLEGIKKAYKEFNLFLSDDRIFYSAASIDHGCSNFLNMWDYQQEKLRIPCTGVLCFCDSLAHGVYKACNMLNLSIPDDISVIGYDDNQLSAYSNPPLTTIYLPKEKILEKCSDILDDILAGSVNESMRYVLDPHLIVRDSVRYL